MDGDAKRELDIMWKHGIGAMRDDMNTLRRDIRNDLKGISDSISSTRKLVITTLVSAVPAWVGLYLTFRR